MFETILFQASEFLSFSNALSGCLGAGVTLFLTYRWRIHNRRAHIAALKRILKAELQTVKDTYVLPQASQSDEDAAKNILSVSLTQNYTTVYDANTGSIGSLGAETAEPVNSITFRLPKNCTPTSCTRKKKPLPPSKKPSVSSPEKSPVHSKSPLREAVSERDFCRVCF